MISQRRAARPVNTIDVGSKGSTGRHDHAPVVDQAGKFMDDSTVISIAVGKGTKPVDKSSFGKICSGRRHHQATNGQPAASHVSTGRSKQRAGSPT
jgi:hypothetical protein